MVFRSLRWQLQVWHALLLVVVLAGFGTTACQLQRASRLREVDRELDSAALEVLRFIRENDRSRPHPPGAPPRRPRTGPNEATGRPPIHYVAWRRDGRELDRSPEAPPEFRFPAASPEGGPRRPQHQTRGLFREAIFTTPPGEVIVVGRSIETELADFQRFAWTLAAAGLGVLGAALAIGAWLAGRAMRPLQDIGASARRIAAGSHSDRIDMAGLPDELASLAGVLNEGFAQIEATLARQRQFTADASHELRTPVSVVLAQTQAALARPRNDAEYRNALEACQRSAQRMRRLVESLLTLARLESGEEPARLEDSDLNELAREASDAVRPLVVQGQLTLDAEFSKSPLPVRADADKLTQVLLNLLGNAVAYNQPGGCITVTTGNSGGEAFVQVSDTGIGIEAEHLPRLFERFYRVEASRTNARGHAGLGLAISRQIIQQHAGRITVESQPGKGSRFTVWLKSGGSAGSPG